jgi:hypothetical protein
MPTLPPVQSRCLLALTIFGLIVPNGLFIYYTMFEWSTVMAAMTNPIAMVFIAEAFTIMFLIAWLIHHFGLKSPGWSAFIVLSLLGSMMFSMPLCLYLWSRRHKRLDA